MEEMTASYDTVSLVVNSWDKVKQTPNWEKEFGLKIFDKLFTRAPLSLTLLFPFGTLGEEMSQSAEFAKCATATASILDFAVGSLGPELDGLFSQLLEIGLEHGNFIKLRADHYKRMLSALVAALKETLGDAFDEDTKKAWTSVFQSLSKEMIEVNSPARRKSDCASTCSGTVISSSSQTSF